VSLGKRAWEGAEYPEKIVRRRRPKKSSGVFYHESRGGGRGRFREKRWDRKTSLGGGSTERDVFPKTRKAL